MSKINIGITPKDVVLAFPVAKPGRYTVTTRFLEMRKTKDTKKDMAVFDFTPTQPVPCTVKEEDGSVKEIAVGGKPLWTLYCVLTPESIFSLRQLQVATRCMAGWPEGSTLLNTDEFPQFNGRQLQVETELEEDNKGRPQSRIARMLPV